MADTDTQETPATPPIPTLEDMQHWTFVMGRAQQMMMEHLAAQMGEAAKAAPSPEQAQQAFAQWPGMQLFGDPAKLMETQSQMWAQGLDIWQRALGQATGGAAAEEKSALAEKADKDRRFAAPEWRDNPLFDTIRQTYLLVSERLLGSVDALEGVDEATREKLRFSTKAFVDAMSPSNFALTNPQVLERAAEPRAEPAHGLDICWAIFPRGSLPMSSRARSRSGATSPRRRQCRLPERDVPADPIFARHRQVARCR